MKHSVPKRRSSDLAFSNRIVANTLISDGERNNKNVANSSTLPRQAGTTTEGLARQTSRGRGKILPWRRAATWQCAPARMARRSTSQMPTGFAHTVSHYNQQTPPTSHPTHEYNDNISS